MTSQTSAALGRAALPFLPTPMGLGTSWGTGIDRGHQANHLLLPLPSYRSSALWRQFHSLTLIRRARMAAWRSKRPSVFTRIDPA